ncbi:MAG: hypothetical protein K5776_06515 [Lachnospiraceae bacterium]|nr:hypothetical protein [Lachnospiraceae bacterium]
MEAMSKDTYDPNSRIDDYLEALGKDSGLKNDILKVFSDYRTAESKEMPLESKLYLLGISVPLIGFAYWVLNEASKNGRKKVYFLSRDGYQPYLIAKKISESLNLETECRYLNVSRLSARIPTYKLDPEKSIDLICVGGIDVTPFGILKRGGLSEEECENILKETSLTDIRDKILNYREVLEIREELKKCDLLKEYIVKYSDHAFDDAIGYFKQEGLCDDEKIAIVDSGWIGTLQQSLETLIKCVNPNADVAGYYFGLYESPKTGNYNSFYFSPSGAIRRKARFSNSLFEAVVSSSEGMTLRYKKEDERYYPVFNDAVNPNQTGIESNIEVLFMLLERIGRKSFGEVSTDICEKIFNLLMANPSKLEVETFGDYIFSDDVTDKSLKKVAAELSVEELKNQRLINKLLIVLGIKHKTIRESAWIEGSAVKAYGNTNNSNRELGHIRIYKTFVYCKKQFERMIGVGKNA